MNKGNNIISEYYVVTDRWSAKEYDSADDALKELGNNAYALFVYRLF